MPTQNNIAMHIFQQVMSTTSTQDKNTSNILPVCENNLKLPFQDHENDLI